MSTHFKVGSAGAIIAAVALLVLGLLCFLMMLRSGQRLRP